MLAKPDRWPIKGVTRCRFARVSTRRLVHCRVLQNCSDTISPGCIWVDCSEKDFGQTNPLPLGRCAIAYTRDAKSRDNHQQKPWRRTTFASRAVTGKAPLAAKAG